MNARLQPGTATPVEAAPTLGGLLYCDDGKPRTSEEEWVALVRAIAAGETSGFGTLYMWTHGIVFTSILRITGNRTAAEELTVEAFQDVWRGASAYDPASDTVVGWVMNLARARALQHERIDRGTRAVTMRAAVEKLTTGERQAIEDTFFKGLTCAEVAARGGILTATIKSRVRSGLERMKTLLTNAYAEP
jgi:RNA polymerase sigma-70 factor, ECF subfamily